MKLSALCCVRQGKKRCRIVDMPFKLWDKWLKPFNRICFPSFMRCSSHFLKRKKTKWRRKKKRIKEEGSKWKLWNYMKLPLWRWEELFHLIPQHKVLLTEYINYMVYDSM